MKNKNDSFDILEKANKYSYGYKPPRFVLISEEMSYSEKKTRFKNASRIFSYAQRILDYLTKKYPDADSVPIQNSAAALNANYVSETVRVAEEGMKVVKEQCGDEAYLLMSEYYIEGCTIKELSKKYGMSETQIRNQINEYTKIIFGDEHEKNV